MDNAETAEKTCVVMCSGGGGARQVGGTVLDMSVADSDIADDLLSDFSGALLAQVVSDSWRCSQCACGNGSSQ